MNMYNIKNRRRFSGNHNWAALHKIHQSIKHSSFIFVSSSLLFLQPTATSAQTVNLADVGTTISGLRLDGIDDRDYSGSGLAGAGDINGDGFSDLIVGARQARPNGNVNAGERNRHGAAFLIYGRPQLTNFDLELIEPAMGVVRFNGVGFFDRAGCRVSSAGDVDADGLSDFLISAPRADGRPPFERNNGKSYLIYSLGEAIPSEVTYRAWARGGQVAHPKGIGVVGDGSDFDSPASRVKIGFFGEPDSGGPGLNGASLQEVTLFRHKDLIQNVGVSPGAIANVSWRVTTNRERYTNVWMKLIWTAMEVSGLNRENLIVYEAPTLDGPWIQSPTQANEHWRRRIVVDTLPFDNGTKYFIIVDESFDARKMANEVVECLLGQRPAAPHHDVDRDGSINISDVVTLMD
jgi:hypothetical protein